MRITQSSIYSNFLFDQGRNLNALADINTQIANGKKILYGYEDVSIYTEQLRLDNREVTLTQAKDVSNGAREFSNQTDVVLGQFTDVLDSFKTKLLAAANDIHSETSREAIAKELDAMRGNLLSLANTSIAGQYIFSGSKIDVQPFDDYGNYQGNTTSLNALVGSNNELKYNMDGLDVFEGKDSDYYKLVSTNVKRLNQTELHLDVMTTNRKSLPPSEVYITETDTIRDLVGDTDDDATNDANTVFYLRGVSPTGDSVKHKFDLDANDTVQTLLDRIDKAYNDTVDVSLNDWGEIIVKDKHTGSSLLEFHLVGAVDRSAGAGSNGAADVDDLNDIVNNSNVDIIDFMKSYDVPTKSVNTISAITDTYEDNVFKFHTDFADVGVRAETDTMMSEVFDAPTIELSGTSVDGSGVAAYSFSTAGKTFQDFVDDIKTNFAPNFGDLDIVFRDGEMVITDSTVDPTKGDSALSASSFAITMTTKDASGDVVNDFSLAQSVALEREYFSKQMSTLTSNVMQFVNDTSDYAVDYTRLSDVSALDTLNNNSLTMNIKDINGVEKEVFINFRNDTVNQSKNITAGAGSTTITLDENFDDLKVGSMVYDGTNYVKVTDIDLSNKQVTFASSIDAGATSLEFVEPYQTSTIKTNSAASTTDVGIIDTGAVTSPAPSNALLTNMIDDLRIGAVVNDGTKDLVVTDVDLHTGKVMFDQALTVGATQINLVKQKLEIDTNMELRVGDKLNINGETVTVNFVDDEQNVYIYNKIGSTDIAFSAGDTIGAEYSQTNSYFEIDGKTYSIFNENFEDIETEKAAGKNDTEKTTEYNTKNSIELQLDFSPSAEVGDYVHYNGQYREIDRVYQSINGMEILSDDGTDYTLADNSTVPMAGADVKNSIYFSRDLDFVPTNNAKVDLVKTGEIALSENFNEIPSVGDYLRIGNDYLEVTSVDNDNNTVSVKPQYDGVIYEGEEIDLVKPITTKGDDITYKQLSDIISMVLTDSLPTEDNKQPAYYDAIEEARRSVDVGLNDKGQLEIRDLKNSVTNLEFALFDTRTDHFEDVDGNDVVDNKGPALMFQANNALTIDDQHVDFFAKIDQAIQAVRDGIYISDSESTNARSTGVQGAIQMLDHLNDHMAKMQTVAGSQTNALDYSIERTEMQILHIKTLKSEVMDLDLAEASIKLQQYSLNYQAMLSTISKVNSLSLVNYI
jgi:flagellar hook-associated protein 3 FlgL